MSLPPVSRSRLHEFVLALCVTGCIAVGLRPHEVQRPQRAETIEGVDLSTTAAATEEPTAAAERRDASGSSTPRAR